MVEMLKDTTGINQITLVAISRCQEYFWNQVLGQPSKYNPHDQKESELMKQKLSECLALEHGPLDEFVDLFREIKRDQPPS